MKDNQIINSEKTDKSKRRALLGVAGLTAFATWHKPVINSVVLPVHAQTSVAGATFFSAPTQVVLNNSNSFSPLDILIPKAHAGRRGRGGLRGRGAKATSVGDNRYQIEIRNRRNTLARTGTLTLGEAGVLRPTSGSTCRFDIINPENNNNAGIVNSLMSPAFAGMNPNSNGQRVEREATPWVAEIVEVTQNDIVLDISELGTTVIPAGQGQLPALLPCDDSNQPPG